MRSFISLVVFCFINAFTGRLKIAYSSATYTVSIHRRVKLEGSWRSSGSNHIVERWELMFKRSEWLDQGNIGC